MPPHNLSRSWIDSAIRIDEISRVLSPISQPALASGIRTTDSASPAFSNLKSKSPNGTSYCPLLTAVSARARR
jgi:hypothetical protein